MRITAALGLSAVLLLGISPPTASAGTTVAVDDSNDGKAVTVHPGDTLVVTLGATQWEIAAPEGEGLTAAGEQQVALDRPGPGASGRTSRSFSATGVGRATVSASRTSCGEALRCTPEQAGWAVVVHVVAVPRKLPFTGAPVGSLALAGGLLLLLGTASTALGRKSSSVFCG